MNREQQGQAESSIAHWVAPLTADEFFRDYWEKRPVHLRGAPERGTSLLSSQELMAALVENPVLPGRLFLSPQGWGEAQPDLQRLTRDERAARLQAYFDNGYPLMWNSARAASAPVARACAELAQALQANVWPNVDATSASGTPFDFHFDAHEVLAVQCAGRKTWQISHLRADRPLEEEEMGPVVAQALAQARGPAREQLWMEFTVEPGDAVYIPRGQFHNAYTPEGRSLHVTFALRPACGYDLVQTLRMLALSNPLLGDFLPPPALDPDGAHGRERLAQMRAALHALLDSETLTREMNSAHAALVARGNKSTAMLDDRGT